MMNAKAKFCQSAFPWSFDIKWQDTVGHLRLSGNRLAKIRLATGITADHYDRLVVTILDVNNGKIDSNGFLFRDFLKGRIDSRTKDHPSQKFEVVSHVAWDWFIAIPADTTPIVDAIKNYIELFTQEVI